MTEGTHENPLRSELAGARAHLLVRTAAIANDIVDEVKAARAKFPDPRLSLAALTEEVGELAQAALELERLDPNAPLRVAFARAHDVYREAVQVAAMAIRVATEGDPSFESMTKDLDRWWGDQGPRS